MNLKRGSSGSWVIRESYFEQITVDFLYKVNPNYVILASNLQAAHYTGYARYSFRTLTNLTSLAAKQRSVRPRSCEAAERCFVASGVVSRPAVTLVIRIKHVLFILKNISATHE